MTMPSERTRALIWAGGLLIDLARDRTLPVSIRRRAVVIARHFPTVEDVELMADDTPTVLLGPMLGAVEEEWKHESGSHGPLRHVTRFGWPDDDG